MCAHNFTERIMFRLLVVGLFLQLSLFSDTQFRIKPQGHLTFVFKNNSYLKYSNAFHNFQISYSDNSSKSIISNKHHAYLGAKYAIEYGDNPSVLARESNSSRRDFANIYVSDSNGMQIGSFEGIYQHKYPAKFLFHNHKGKEIATAIFDKSKTKITFYDASSSEEIGSMQKSFRRNFDKKNQNTSHVDYIYQYPIHTSNGEHIYVPPKAQITNYDYRNCYVDNGLIYYWDVDLQGDLIPNELLWCFATFVADRYPLSSLFPINQTLKPLDKSISFSVIPQGYCSITQERTASQIYLKSSRFDSMTLQHGKSATPVDLTSSYLRTAYKVTTPSNKLEAIARFFSMGTLFNSLKTLDIYQNGEYFGQIAGAYSIDQDSPFPNPSAEFYIYDKQGNLVCKAYLNALYNKVILLDQNGHDLGLIKKTCTRDAKQVDYSWDAKIENTFRHKSLLYFLTIFLCDTYHSS